MTEKSDNNLVTVTIDGVEIKAPRNAMLIEVADEAGINIPRFCYHKHLSVAANCRMCMVEVEKAPKPLPACATPVMDGMQVHTRSELALDAQKGTMEFLLINHPLDCPVCDQGGECELQDIAVGYGSDVSRFTERKRVVKDKNIGPLVSTDMTRCIHCTRCVRFGNEIAGVSELGATGRGEFMEIGTYIEKSLSSELSGNVIDLCPVGALNAKPSRMKGRAWELEEHHTISAHDSFGSNLTMHTLRNEVIRVVPQENAEINETWISDRDRFSYEGMYSENRLNKVMHKKNGEWTPLRWSNALQEIAAVLKSYSPEDIGVLVSPNQSNEEIYLMQKVARSLNINNIDHRTQQTDFSHQQSDSAFPWLGMGISEVEQQDVILIIGSDIRSEQPMLAHKIRKASMRGAKVIVVNPQFCQFNMSVSVNNIVKPQEWLKHLIALLSELNKSSNKNVPSQLQDLLNNNDQQLDYSEVIDCLINSKNSCVLVGSLMQQHYEYSSLRALAHSIAELSDSTFGYISLASNTSGACLLGALPHRGVMGEALEVNGMTCADMFASPCKVYVIMGLELEWDSAVPAQALEALENADVVICLHSHVTESMKSYCDWMLPINCYAESEGTKINLEGRWQAHSKIVSSDEEVKDGWKALRMLGVELGLENFDYFTIEDVQKEIAEKLPADFEFTNAIQSIPKITVNQVNKDALYCAGSLPIYTIDALVRNAPSLREAQGINESELHVHEQDVRRHGLVEGKWVKVSQGDQSGIFACVTDNNVLPGTVYIPRGLPRSEKLGAYFGQVQLKNLSA